MCSIPRYKLRKATKSMWKKFSAIAVVAMFLLVGLVTASPISTTRSSTETIKNTKEANSFSNFSNPKFRITSEGTGIGFYHEASITWSTPVFVIYKTGETLIMPISGPGVGIGRCWEGRHILIILGFTGVISDPGDDTFGLEGELILAFGWPPAAN